MTLSGERNRLLARAAAHVYDTGRHSEMGDEPAVYELVADDSAQGVS
ncbi:MAG TPA: hypothetical protein VFJ72_16550 [Rubrobacteraceae bacterium]|nr:hypothetical protein [Rubrobacteraceae bacterium]